MIFGPIKLVLRILGVVVGVVVLYFAVTFLQIWMTGQQHYTGHAGAILVFGTAEYNGVPSPELQDRLDHALALYQLGRAPYVAVTGGKRPGDQFTEAGVSATYLKAHGVPTDRIMIGGGDDTWQNVGSVAPALRSHQVNSVIDVTDPFHEYRAMAITSDYHFVPHPSPVTGSAVRGSGLWRYYAKETIEVGVARVVGYATLSNWLHVD